MSEAAVQYWFDAAVERMKALQDIRGVLRDLGESESASTIMDQIDAILNRVRQ